MAAIIIIFIYTGYLPWRHHILKYKKLYGRLTQTPKLSERIREALLRIREATVASTLVVDEASKFVLWQPAGTANRTPCLCGINYWARQAGQVNMAGTF